MTAMPIYYPNMDAVNRGSPTNWTLLKRLVWLMVTRKGERDPSSDVVNIGRVDYMILTT